MDSPTATAVLLATVSTVGLAGAAAGFGPVGAQEEPTPDDRPAQSDERSISVEEQRSAEAPPDQAVVAVAVVTEGDDPAAVRDDLATATTRSGPRWRTRARGATTARASTATVSTGSG